MSNLTIKTTLHPTGALTTPSFMSNSKTVQQIIVETYLAYRQIFFRGMITKHEYFSVIRCIKR